ncbi:hypothetical protein HNQ71_007042 [Mesorhizobium sangaii]|uniref:Integrase catalytic domain-containing protein n=1 Tax=Mesorhizobium sangaii TaxID=505389 RepID=A0A841PVZ8_9HYPH|nr:hypothetical protein [Mesorhizobium sangaii]
MLVREQKLLIEVLTELRRFLPFQLLGFDTDNDSVFLNETIRDYCLDAGIEFTRCRPYRKNDQAFVEQKNGAVVRRIVGYRRLEGLEAAAALAQLYSTVRLFVNFFQPSFELAGKERDGARVRKRYHLPAGNTLPAADGKSADTGVRSREAGADRSAAGSAERHASRTTAPCGPGARSVPLKLANRVEGGRNTTYCEAETKTEAGTAAS